MSKLPENWAIQGCPELAAYFYEKKIKGLSGSQPNLHYKKIGETWDFYNHHSKWEPITVQQYIDSQTPEREIIGYRLVKPEYERAAIIIAISETSIDEHFKLRDVINFTSNSLMKSNLEQAGVLDLWFEPVYKEEEKVFEIGLLRITVKDKKAIVKGTDGTECDLTGYIKGLCSFPPDLYTFHYNAKITDAIIKQTILDLTFESKLSEWIEVYNAIKD